MITYDEIILEIANLRLGFKNKLFENLSLQISHGEFVTVLGENGIGKTSLVRCLLGQIIPQSGHISFWKEDITNIDRQILNQKVAWVLSTGENVPQSLKLKTYFNSISTLYPKGNKEILHRLVDRFKLSTNKAFGELSLGEWSKFKLCRALSINPQFIVLDELTANLSMTSKDVILEELIGHFSDSRPGVLYISHNEEEALKISDKIFYLTFNGLQNRSNN